MPLPNSAKELQSLLGIMTYLEKFSLDTVDVSEPFRKLI